MNCSLFLIFFLLIFLQTYTLFPEGEIYYIRNYKELQKENISQSNSKGIMDYDGVVAELNVEYKFKRPELMLV